MSRRLRPLLPLLAAHLLSGAGYLSIARSGNNFTIQATEGTLELEWISASAFRFSRAWGRTPEPQPVSNEKIEVVQSDRGTDLRFDTSELSAVIEKAGLRLRVREPGGKLLLYDESEITRSQSSIFVERRALYGEQYYGLGARTAGLYDARGDVVAAARPFLLSSLGYGIHHSRAGEYSFDLARSDQQRWRVTLRGGQRFEFFFYLGSTPKTVLEEHLTVAGSIDWDPSDLDIRPARRAPAYSWRMPRQWTLCEAVAGLNHAAMSAMLAPAFSLDAYDSPRAEQLSAVIPIVTSQSPRAASALRNSLLPYHITYLQEARDRGFPVIRPLPLQYPGDAEGLKRTDEFLLGDEILVAPVCGESARRTVYLPRGNWTGLHTGALHAGRQTIEIEAPAGVLPLFARNGAIIPWAAQKPGGPMLLDYFPKLAAEFFLWEPEEQFITQMHAAPAAGIFRFQIESVKDRTYEWRLHHTGRPSRVYQLPARDLTEVMTARELAPGCWFYDAAARRLHFQVASVAGGDDIVNVSY